METVVNCRCVCVLVSLLGIFATAWSSVGEARADDVFSKKKIVEVMRKVRDYQLAHPWRESDRDWIRGTYYTGVMGLYRTWSRSGLGYHATAMFLDDRLSTKQLRQWFRELVEAPGGSTEILGTDR